MMFKFGASDESIHGIVHDYGDTIVMSVSSREMFLAYPASFTLVSSFRSLQVLSDDDINPGIKPKNFFGYYVSDLWRIKANILAFTRGNNPEEGVEIYQYADTVYGLRSPFFSPEIVEWNLDSMSVEGWTHSDKYGIIYYQGLETNPDLFKPLPPCVHSLELDRDVYPYGFASLSGIGQVGQELLKI